MPAAISVYVEAGSKRVFACAQDWPGWCRSGKTEALALEALAAYAPRYAPLAAEAAVAFPAGAGERFDVTERLEGGANVDFGALGKPSAADSLPVTPAEADRLVRLLEASWSYFARVAEAAPAELRKGPRGGGRDTAKIRDHVIAAEVYYCPRLGIKAKPYPPEDVATTKAIRERIVAAIRAAPTGLLPDGGTPGWPIPYAARRIAWHALDHAWEIEDRAP